MMLIALSMFAQVEPVMPTTVTGGFIAISMMLVGLVVWLMRHVFLTTIPGILAEMAAARETYTSEAAKARETFTETNADERRLCAEQFALVNAGMSALAQVGVVDRQAIVAEINQHVTESAVAYRHELNNVIQQAVLGKELYLAQKSKEIEAAKATAGISPATH